MRRAALCLTLLLPSLALCGETARPKPRPVTAALSAAAKAAEASASDLDLRPSRWDTAMALPEAEGLLKDPLSLPASAGRWKEGLRRSEDACGLLGVGRQVLGAPAGTLAREFRHSMAPESLGLAPDLRVAIARILWDMDIARAAVLEAADSLTGPERLAALQEVKAAVTSENGPRSEPAVYAAMARFRLSQLLEAGSFLLCAVSGSHLPALRKAAARSSVAEKRWKLPFGEALLVGPGERTFTAGELKGVALLIHLGRKSVYQGPVAAAGEGEVKVVIDLAEDVTVQDPSGGPTGGSGIFGVGLLFLPNPAGAKKLSGGDFSLGSGLFGVGGLTIEGKANVLRGGRFSQAAGAFGAGVLWSKGEDASFEADLSAQGYGFTQGAGVFRHQGARADLQCGLRYPDPREAQAALSMCQGAAYGRRAFAGGGAGLAHVATEDGSIVANYFGQGSGYWHGIGALFVRGDRNRLKARRYAQGSGIHAAVGVLSVAGSSNALVNWGVGPAFGWDYGAGFWELHGDDNTARADWGTGRGDANGHGLAAVTGDRNKLLLPEFGTGFHKRAAPGYGLASVEGKDNRLGLSALPAETRAHGLALSPWGAVVSRSGLILDPKLTLASADWPAIDHAAAVEKERAELSRMFEAALQKTGAERVAGLLHVTSSFSLESGVPRMALAELFRTPDQDLAHLEAALSAERFDEYLWLRVLLAGFGPQVLDWAKGSFDKTGGTLRSLILQSARYAKAQDALPMLEAALKDEDWRVRREAAGALGHLFSQEQGDEPGRLRFFEVAVSSDAAEELIKRMGWKRAADVMSALSLAGQLTADERGLLVHRFPGPNEPLPKEALTLFLDLLEAQPERSSGLKAELESARRLRDRAAELLKVVSADPDPDVADAGLASLGAVGRPEDSSFLTSHLKAKDAKRRDAAASGLGRMGPGALQAVASALSSPERRVRSAACKASALSWDPETVALLARCLKDRAPEVRGAGCAAMFAVQGALSESKKRFRGVLSKLSTTDPSPSVRAAAAYAAAQLPK
ncbi:MAG: HEAT repeat domain-containing protein [Elusimicrobia bacterium]|nr:HEAT repeat domain-containing protein [Elusimicrobiota bacterium]